MTSQMLNSSSQNSSKQTVTLELFLFERELITMGTGFYHIGGVMGICILK